MKSNTFTVKKIMMQYGVTLEIVSGLASCTMVDAYEALHPQYFRLCPLIMIARVRRAVENELYERGWNGRGERLWTEYDASLERYLRGRRIAPKRRLRT